MLGTGEFASSASESTIPSCTSSSCTVGTYCRQIGSPGDLIRSTIAGEIRNSKFSAACWSAAMGPVCSSPKRAASASSDAMLFLRSSSCQVSTQLLGVDHQIVARRVVRWDGRGSAVSAFLIEPARRGIVRTRARLYHHQPCGVRRAALLHFLQELGPNPLPLARTVHDDPIEIERTFGPRRRAPARVADQLLAVERAGELIVLIAGQVLIEQLDRGGDLFVAEEACVPRQLLKSYAVRVPQRAQRAAHGLLSPLGRRAPRSPRCAGSPPVSPPPPSSPCATGRPSR